MGELEQRFMHFVESWAEWRLRLRFGIPQAILSVTETLQFLDIKQGWSWNE